jgi:N-acyl homoserine lactone hydrolase
MTTAGSIKLYVFDGGRAHLPDMSHLTPDRNVGTPVTIPLLMFLIDHPKGLVVFDTGLDTDRVRDPFVEATPVQRIDRQMRQLGYDPDDVRYVVLSHLHLDHVGSARLFPRATFVVRRQELRAAWWPDAYEHGYEFEALLPMRQFKYLQPADDEELDVFQDGSLVCIDTRGHTEGHQSLVVNLANSGRVVLVGDAAQVDQNLNDKVPPGLCWSSQLAVHSLERLQHLQAQGALLILGHELSALKTLRIAPVYYD